MELEMECRRCRNQVHARNERNGRVSSGRRVKEKRVESRE